MRKLLIVLIIILFSLAIANVDRVIVQPQYQHYVLGIHHPEGAFVWTDGYQGFITPQDERLDSCIQANWDECGDMCICDCEWAFGDTTNLGFPCK
jgi:hypothetical protein